MPVLEAAGRGAEIPNCSAAGCPGAGGPLIEVSAGPGNERGKGLGRDW